MIIRKRVWISLRDPDPTYWRRKNLYQPLLYSCDSKLHGTYGSCFILKVAIYGETIIDDAVHLVELGDHVFGKPDLTSGSI